MPRREALDRRESPLMLTTLYCDASFCPDEMVGGWAIWVRNERARHIEKGPTPEYCNNSAEAELAAIYAGIYRIVTRWPDTTAILVRSDCQAALGWATDEFSPKPEKKSAVKLTKKIQLIKREHPVRLIPRWVKAHRKGSETDVYLNRRVDEMAREVMLSQRKGKR